jgi:predicted  nucleic acid-binding Zn-ribbon protein
MPDAHPLLALQRLDSSADAVRKRCAELPERAALCEQEAQAAALLAARTAAAEQRRVLAGQLREAEALVADLDARAREVERSLYSGATTVVRELEALQEELRDARRRQDEREEAELVVMEQAEQLDVEIAALEVRSAEVEARSAELRAAIDAEEARAGAELARLADERAALVPQVPGALLSEYETLRAAPRLGGRAAAQLQNGTCGGCSVSLPIAVAARIQRERAEIAHCPRCGRILAF